jgi:hypothetical protein
VEVVGAPGAKRSVVELLLLKQATWSAWVVGSMQSRMETGPTSASYTAPTEIAFATQAGADIWVPEPSFPEETNESTPLARRVLIAVANAMV